MKTRFSFLTLACAMAMGIHGQATASTATGTLTVSGITITLYDLAPDDGIDPYIRFDSFASALNLSAYVRAFDGSRSSQDYDFIEPPALSNSADPFSPGSVNAAIPGQSATGTSGTDTFTLSATATHVDPAPGSSYRPFADAEAHLQAWGHKFVLSPKTLMTITGNHAVSSVISDRDHLSLVTGSFNLTLSAQHNLGSNESANLGGGYLWHLSNHDTLTYEDTGSFGASFLNFNQDELNGWIKGQAYVKVNMNIPAIPEAETLALAATGLLVVGALGRRRKKN